MSQFQLQEKHLNALHEAGHALAAHALGLAVEYMLLQPEDQRAEKPGQAKIQSAEDPCHGILVVVAGYTAEKIAQGTLGKSISWLDLRSDHGYLDFIRASELAANILGEPLPPLPIINPKAFTVISPAEKQVLQIFSQPAHFEKLLSLTETLFVRRSLRGDELGNILDSLVRDCLRKEFKCATATLRKFTS